MQVNQNNEKLVLGDSQITVTMTGIGKSFGSVSVLRDVQLDIVGGEIHSIMGENGAGKSTLVKIISGVQRASTGTMCIDGTPIKFDKPRDAEAYGITIMHQELSLIPDMTVAENVMLGHEPLNGNLIIDQKTIRKTAKEALARFGFNIDIDTPVRDLRVGEMQLVEIARALLMNARLLIMDEPTSALSQTEADILMEVIRDLVLQGVAVLYISHRMDEVFEISDRITVLRDGDLVGSVMATKLDQQKVIEMMVGRKVEINRMERQTKPSLDTVLKVNDLCVSTRSRSVLENVSFSLKRGEILGIGGLLGSGRTELLETLFGVRGSNYSGDIILDGQQVTIKSAADAVHHGLGLITEDRKTTGLILNDSIADNIILPLLSRTSRFGIRSKNRKITEAINAIEKLRVMATGPEHIVGTLSGGNQQKVVLGKWLATNPSILLLDEPTRGIDIGAKDEIYSLVSKLADSGMSILIASSEISEFLAVCDRVIVLCEGRVTGSLTANEMTFDRIKHLSMQFATAENPTGV